MKFFKERKASALTYIVPTLVLIGLLFLFGFLIFGRKPKSPPQPPSTTTTTSPTPTSTPPQSEESSIAVKGREAVFKAINNQITPERIFHLIGIYHQWDPDSIYISGYNYYNPYQGDVNQSYTKKIHFGRPERLTIDLGSGNVGIGTQDPKAKLEIFSDSDEILIFSRTQASSPAIFKLGQDSTLVLNVAKNDLLILKGNKVGIGTTNPAYTLDVNGTIRGKEICIGDVCKTSWPTATPTGGGGGAITAVYAGSGLKGGGTSGNITLSLDTSGILNCTNATTHKIVWSATQNKLICAQDQTVGEGFALWGLSSSSLYPASLNWKVGIGTANPQAKLEVFSNSDEILRLSREGALSPVRFKLDTESVFTLSVGSSDILTIVSGNVGIGTQSPSRKLDVKGYIKSDTGFCIGSDCITSWPSSTSEIPNYWGLSGSNLYASSTNWNVGIGTKTPSAKLEIFSTSDEILRLSREGALAPVRFKLATDSAFTLNSGGNDIIVIKDNKVGIGTSTPQYKLDIEGEVRARAFYSSLLYSSDIIFQKDGRPLWRMYEKEDGIYLENLITGKVYKILLEEIKP